MERQATSSAFSRSRIVQAVQQEKQDVLMVLFSGQPGSSKQPSSHQARGGVVLGREKLKRPSSTQKASILNRENKSPRVVTSYSNNFPSDVLFHGTPLQENTGLTGTVAVRG